jgi:hypothetical protein
VRLALSFSFEEEQDGDDVGAVWTWDLDDPRHTTIQHLGSMKLPDAKAYAEKHGYPFYGD